MKYSITAQNMIVVEHSGSNWRKQLVTGNTALTQEMLHMANVGAAHWAEIEAKWDLAKAGGISNCSDR